MNREIRIEIRAIPPITDSEASMKMFYCKSVEFNSKHCNRKLDVYYKWVARSGRCSMRGMVYKYTE